MDITEPTVYILQHMNNTSTHAARLAHHLYKDNYKVVIWNDKASWFKRVGDAWVAMPSQVNELRIKLSEEVAPLIAEARMSCQHKIFAETTPEHEKEFEKTRFRKLFEIEKSLHMTGFKNMVIRECIPLFYEN